MGEGKEFELSAFSQANKEKEKRMIEHEISPRAQHKQRTKQVGERGNTIADSLSAAIALFLV